MPFDPRQKIVGGLDFNFGLAVKLLLELHDPTVEELRKVLKLLGDSIELHTTYRASCVKAGCLELRAEFRDLQPPPLQWQVLDVLESSSASVSIRRLAEAVRIALFEKRQLRLPGV